MDDPRFYGLPDAWYPGYMAFRQWSIDLVSPIFFWWTENMM